MFWIIRVVADHYSISDSLSVATNSVPPKEYSHTLNCPIGNGKLTYGIFQMPKKFMRVNQ